MAERSFLDLAVEDVMKEAGLTRTAFYRYFRDLEQLLLRLLADVADDLYRAADTWLRSDDPRQSLWKAATALASIYRERGPLLLAFEGAAAGGLEVERAWRQAVDGYVRVTAVRIEDLNRSGAAQVSDPTETARALVWMTERYLLEVFGRPGGTLTQIEPAVDVIATIWERTLALS